MTKPAYLTGYCRSLFYRLDPLTKFLIVICISTLAMASTNLVLLFALILVCIIIGVVARVSLKSLWGYVKSFTHLIAFLIVVQSIFYPFPTFILLRVPEGSPVLANYTLLSLDGICYGIALGIRFMTVVITATTFSLTTNSRDFILSMKRLRIPFELIFMVNIALRFIPDIKDKASEVMLAQKARGLELEKGSILKKLKALLPLILPLVIMYMFVARNLAVAMESRAFRWRKERTYMRCQYLSKADYAVMAITVTLTVLGGYVFWGYGQTLKIV